MARAMGPWFTTATPP
ncbi:hypothetical protein MTR67_002799 [Solanum verrucosum]|uniref:Uncharacterized protein n=1 Tax=Solanum verrucosum TaxID=315347 RepID=A0AAF0T953_SOLVR|nr:hypothetical protein MTR67_002799 [Solanum verrucosum]